MSINFGNFFFLVIFRARAKLDIYTINYNSKWSISSETILNFLNIISVCPLILSIYTKTLGPAGLMQTFLASANSILTEKSATEY